MENRLVYLIFFIISLVTCVRAWGQEGHKIVAQIAADQLSSSASDLVRQFCGSKSLPDISPLPDDYDHEPEGRWSEPCHFCNLPRSAVHFEMKYCPSYCVVRSILNYTSKPSLVNDQRLLKFIFCISNILYRNLAFGSL